MRNVCWRVGVVGCVVGLFVADVEAQRATISLRPTGGTVRKECVGGPDAGQACTTTTDCENDDQGVIHPDCQRLCDGDPGETCETSPDCGGNLCEQQCFCNAVVSNPGVFIWTDIFATGWGPQPLAGWQVQPDLASISDSVRLHGWERPIPAVPCSEGCPPQYPVCEQVFQRCEGPGHEPCLGAFICEQCTAGGCERDDYVFFGCPEIRTLDYTIPDVRLVAATLEVWCQRVYTVPKYLATLIVVPTPTACGNVTVKLFGSPGSALLAPFSGFMEPLDIEGLTLEFGPCECTGILDSDPPDCAVDARQTSDPSGTPEQGMESIALNLEGPTPDVKCPSTVGLDPPRFTMREVPGMGTFFPDSVTHDTPAEGWITLHFPPATPDKWTCVEFGTSPNGPDEVCFGYLPGDADNDRMSLASDIPHLIDCIMGDIPCGLYQCDIDRSGLCGASDILREIDLLNGAEEYFDWLNESLPSCP